MAKPPEKQPRWFDWLIARLGGFASLAGILLALGYLLFALTGAQDGSCSYRGDIEIHPPFEPIFEEYCLVMGPPISRIATVTIDGYGDKTIQYFEGTLLMAAPNDDSQEVQTFPLGTLLQPKNQPPSLTPITAQFDNFLAETGSDQFLGEPITDFIQMSDRLVVYYKNTSLRWNPNSQTISHQSLGRDHLLNNYPELLIEGETIQVEIPNTSIIRFIFGDIQPEAVKADDFAVNIAVKYPILYAGKQQVVTVEVIDRISNEPVSDLTLTGLVHFEDLDGSVQSDNSVKVNFRLEPTDIAGIYVATINLPDHPNGVAGREVTIDVSFDNENTEKVTAVKKFQTWW